MKLSRRSAAAVLMVAGLTLTAGCSNPGPTYPEASVVVDVAAGLNNPEVALDGDVAGALFTYLDTRAGDVYPTLGATPRLGFNGLVVRLDGGDDASSTIRVTTHAIYITDSLGTVRISDLTGTAFDIVWPAVKPEVDEATVEAVEAAD